MKITQKVAKWAKGTGHDWILIPIGAIALFAGLWLIQFVFSLLPSEFGDVAWNVLVGVMIIWAIVMIFGDFFTRK